MYGRYNSKLRSGLLNNSTNKYWGTHYQTWWKWTKNPKSTPRNKKILKKCLQVWKITNFDRQAALFNGAPMGAVT
jgi:hypothetical protein